MGKKFHSEIIKLIKISFLIIKIKSSSLVLNMNGAEVFNVGSVEEVRTNETVGSVILSDIFGAVLEALRMEHHRIIEKYQSVDQVWYLTNISNSKRTSDSSKMNCRMNQWVHRTGRFISGQFVLGGGTVIFRSQDSAERRLHCSQ